MSTRSEVIRDLKDKLRRWEGQQRCRSSVVPTGAAALDRLLPQGGLAAGTLLEWLSAGEGQGCTTLTLVLAGRVQAEGGAAVVIDEGREFYPPAAAALGLDLQRTAVVRPTSARAALWVWEQALRSEAVGATLGWLGERVDARALRRLQLAAEAGGGVGFLLRPASCRGDPSWAEARLLVEALPSPDSAAPRRRLGITLLHGRGGFGAEAIQLELSHEAGDVHLAAVLADPAVPRRAARA